MKYLKLLLFLCFINVYTLVYIWIDIIMQKNWVAKCKVQVQSVSHNLIKYTHGYLIAAYKNQKVPFLDIQNKKPCVRLMPPSVGRNACWDKVQPIIKSFLLKICLGNQIFLQELFFLEECTVHFFFVGVSAHSSVIWNGKVDSDSSF